MPTIGGVYIPDDQMPQLPAARAAERPGLLDLLGAGSRGAYTALRFGLPAAVDTATGAVTAEDAQDYQRGLARGAAATERAAPGGPMGYQEVDGVGKAGRFVLENLAYSLPYMVPTVAGGLAGSVAGPAGTVAGAVAGGSTLFTGTNAQRASEDGELTRDEAIRSIAVAPAQAAADALVGRFLPGAGKFLGGAAATQSAKGFAGRTLQSVTKAAAVEATTETAQQVGERFAAGLPMSTKEALEEYTAAFITGGAVGGALGLGGGFRSKISDNPSVEELDQQINAELPQLPGPEAFGRGPQGPETNGSTVFADAAGRAAPSIDDLIATPRPISPERRAEEDMRALQGAPQALPAPNNDRLVQGSDGEAANAAFPAELSQAVAQMPTGDLRSALEQGTQRENTPPQVIQAIELELGRRERDGTNNVEDPGFRSKVREIRAQFPSQFTAKLNVNNEAELQAEVNDYIVDKARGGKKGVALAQQLGLLDETGKPTDLSREVSARKAAEAEAASLTENAKARTPEFAAEFKKLRGNSTAPDIVALDPVDEGDLDRQIYQALAGTEGSVQERIAERMGEEVIVSPSSALEALAVKRGLIEGRVGKQGEAQGGLDLTEKGRLVAEAVDAEPVPAVATSTQSEETLGRVGRGDPDPASMERAALKQQIEALAEPTEQRAGGLKRRRRGAARDDIMKLQQMVDQGVPEPEVVAAIQRVQQGQPLFEQPARTETNDLDVAAYETTAAALGQPVDTGATLERARRRRQLEAQRQDRLEAAERALTPRRSKQTLEQEVKTERGRRRQGIKEELKAAYDAGDITAADLSMGLAAANRDEFKSALARLPGQKMSKLVLRGNAVPEAESVNMDRRLQSVNDDFDAALDILASDAQTAYEKRVVAAVKRGVKQMRSEGFEFRLDVIRAGDVNEDFQNNPDGQGQFQMIKEGDKTVALVELRGTSAIGEPGTDFETMLHEMVHAVTATNITIYENLKKPKGDKAAAMADLVEAVQAIKNHLSTKVAQGAQLTAIERRLVNDAALLDYMVGDTKELVAWGMTNREFQQLLETVRIADTTLWGKFVAAVRRILGLAERDTTALENILRAGFDMADSSTVRGDVETLTKDMDGVVQAKVSIPEMSATAGEKAREVFAAGDQALRSGELKDKARKSALGWSSLFNLAKHYLPQMPSIMQFYEAHNERRATMERLAQLFEPVHLAYDTLARKDQREARKVDQLMSYTQFEIDPAKAWTQHKHLQGRKDEARMRRLVGRANQQYRQAGPEALAIYTDMRALNEMSSYMSMALGLHNIAALDPSLTTKVGPTPMDAFRESPSVNESVQDARDFWLAAANNKMADLEAFVETEKSATAGKPRKIQENTVTRMGPIEQQIAITRGNIEAMKQAPYFHLGRHGDHYVTFEIRKDGTAVDQTALDKVADALDKAGVDAEISRDTTQPRVYIRMDNKGQRDAVEQIALKLRDEKLLSQDADGVFIKSGKRDAAGGAGLNPGPAGTVISELVQRIQSDPQYSVDGLSKAEADVVRDQKAAMIAQIKSHYLEAMNDTALTKVLAKRENKPGFSRDMVRNFAQRYQLSVNAISGMSATPKFDAAFTEMRSAVNEARNVDSPAHKDVDVRFDLMAEVSKRQRNQPLDVDNSLGDRVRAYSHAYFLGASPSYVALNMTQLGVLAWPELAKRNGWARSFGAIAKATPLAFRILRAAFDEGLKAGGKRAADAVITQDALKKAGLSQAQADFVMRMMARGIIDIGGATRELGRLAGGNASGNSEALLRYAGAFGLYSETFTRLVTALAARDVHQGSDADTYAADVVAESMLNYSPANQARLLSKQGGLLGPMTPIVSQFLQYSFQVLEKMYREMYQAITPGTDAQAKREARRFLASHAVAVTTLAGSLGLPFASMVALVAEKLVDAVGDEGDEPYDATAAWRDFLADTLGQGAGEVLARGAPRALGFDLSQRAGEQDLLPFTRFLTGRGSFTDRLESQMTDLTGPSLSMVAGIGDGLATISNGETLRGMIEMMPIALKNPLKAGSMYADGYVDGKGNRIPMDSPGARAIMVQALGFQPSEKAEFSEEKGDQASRRASITRTASRLRRLITDAIVDGDNEKARELLAQAQQFDSKNPAFAVLPDIKGSIKRRQRTKALVDAGIPQGVSLKDIQGQQLTSYANY